MGNKKKILLVHPNLMALGGATAVAAWIAEALKDEFAITLLTTDQVDLEGLNRFHGTSLRESDMEVVYPNRLIRSILQLDRDHHSIQPVAYLMRVCRRVRDRYDLVISSATEEFDLGGSGILYVHFPFLARFWGRYRDCGQLSLRAQLGALFRGELRPWMILAGFSTERMKEATFLVNSDWTGAAVHRAYRVPTTTLYPPVTASSRREPWDAREDGFLCIGRLTPQKRMDGAIAILRRVREQRPHLTLHLVGTPSQRPEHRQYLHDLQSLVQTHSNWVRLHQRLPREALLKLMGRMRYGIHLNRDEHFGIAPAELMASGCIVFVHDSGGQVEIVGRDPRLCYQDDEEAFDKIAKVVASPVLQASVLDSLASHQTAFDSGRFMRRIRELVEQMTERRKPALGKLPTPA